MFKTFRENRRLVRDLRTADAVHMQQLDEIAKLTARLKTAGSLADDRGRELQAAKAKLTKTKKLVREQTGADLLVNALRELGVIPKPEKYNAYTEQDRLMSQARAMGQQQGSALGQALGGGQAGFGGLF